MHDRHLRTLVLLAVMAAIILPAAAAQGPQEDDAPRVVRLEALNVGEEYWFKVKGATTENPELGFLPGDVVEVHLDSKGHVAHNIRFGDPIDDALPLLPPGETDVLRFTVPMDATGQTSYWCEPHRDLGMAGVVGFSERKEGPGLEVPGVSLPFLLALLALAACASRRRR